MAGSGGATSSDVGLQYLFGRGQSLFLPKTPRGSALAPCSSCAALFAHDHGVIAGTLLGCHIPVGQVGDSFTSSSNMDLLLQRVTQQAVQYAIRSGITITTGYAIKECSRLLKQAPKSRERDELMQLQLRLESKIRVIAPSIDMIELIAARGNTSLESALSLCKALRYDIQKLGQRLDRAAQEEQHLNERGCKGAAREEADHELVAIIAQIKLLLARIEDAVPLINLAIVTSGVNLSTKLSGTISPSRLLQASTFLTQADTRFTKSPTSRHQVGPTYVVTLYMLFAGHSHRDAGRETTWQEVLHKTHVKLWRVPLDDLYALPGEVNHAGTSKDSSIPAEAKASEFGYQLSLVEDLDDTRLHTYEDGDPRPGPFDGVPEAGIRDIVPIHEISKVRLKDEVVSHLADVCADLLRRHWQNSRHHRTR